MVFEDRLKIETPEGVELELTLAGLGSRVGATFIDILILGFVLVLVLIAIALLSTASVTDDMATLFLGVGSVLIFVIVFGYYLLFETMNSGKTPGKAALGIRVIRVDGTPLGFGAVAIRTLLRAVDLLPAFYATGMVSILATSRNQRLGDLAAGTVVIRDRAAAVPLSAAGMLGTEDLAGLPGWDTSAITEEDLALIRRFVERRPSLTAESRSTLAKSIADRLRVKVVSPGAPEDDESFLLRLLSEKMHRQR
jgi:uncharacterized RDD family membrane protein YckC